MKRFLLFLLISCLLSCSREKDVLRFNLLSDSIQLDWNKANDTNSVIILDNIMEGLTSYADSLQQKNINEFLRPLPALASSWTLFEGGKVYHFHLRKGVFWSDGVKLSARQFVDSWQRLLDPATRSENSYDLYDIEGAKAFAEGKTKDFSKVGIRAIDDDTLEVRLRHPASYFLHLVANVNTFPIRLDLVQKYSSHWADPENLVVLGPYRLQSWEHEKQLVLKANSSYWGTKPAIKTVICKTVPEPLTAAALYESGELDILPRDLPVSWLGDLGKRPDYQTGPRLSVSYLAFNTRKAPFDKAENRRAFIQGFNRQGLLSAFHGSQTVTSSWIPPGMMGYQKDIGLNVKIGGAKFPSSTLHLRYSGTDTWNLAFQMLQKMMRENLNVSLKLDQVDWKEYRLFLSALIAQKLPKGEVVPNIFHLAWVADYPDPHSFMNVFTSDSEGNYTGWKNAHYDELVDRAVATENEAERSRIYAEAQRILLEQDAVIMPLFVTNHQALIRSNIRGVVLNPLDKWFFKNIWKID